MRPTSATTWHQHLPVPDRLSCVYSGTSSAEEMFRVFSKFNPLFFRPRIRAAISEFQADLIKSVREAVHMLQVRTPTPALQRPHEG